ncbi:haloacid dehalogenase type II [Pelomonas sp. APW6]|uniref:(S)-2-haloacid dehalogenase n=1 Tax=Roseateles subflavus TaxID=3053353 RepID=A0ABT7LDZ4_9BURK|nr:haloacid dehalogenase type II [Pelomonas sp. APW6]MDL5031081.1 haloacid dehalogenase type II [Pelomonas sp. APW6]
MAASTVRAVLFDAYGTLFDVHSVALMAEQLFPGQGALLSQRWRDKQIEYSRLCSMSGQYQPFWDLTRAALRHACLSLKLTPGAGGEERLMNEYRHLSAFPENREVLQQLKARGVRAGILSNGDPGMLQIAVQSAGLAPWLDPVLSVHETRRYKTDPAAYALGPAALGLPPREILFVSSNAWDALGATWYGFTTLWVNRQGQPREQLGPPPHHEASSLRGVLALFPDTAS